MTVEQIVELIVSILPSLIAVLTTVGLIIKNLKEFAALKKQVTDLKCIDDLKDQIKEVVNQNYELKKQLNQAMTKIDHVKRK